MKNIQLFTVITLAISIWILSGCTKTREDIIIEQVENQLKSMLKDADSYEFVDLKFAYAVLYKNNIERTMTDIKKQTLPMLRTIWNSNSP